ncbi:hypothetical protein GCM10007901_07720 [Dyella acidisoli]|uniref:Uncharacterized protein n=1 Tax=Dyella acidisoli TaxID=1867834 RepID=A0ABQ5XJK8_9GAMM|nr:hypothetical protein GCM10007901_07720 [Dyella acidisoli]
MGVLGELVVDVGERFPAVDIGFAYAEQVEVGSVQDQQLRHRLQPFPVSRIGESVGGDKNIVQFGVDRRCLPEKEDVKRAGTYGTANRVRAPFARASG